tara:strand:+ start:17157 stop:17690 length:534 start_codon:yes stop_codon:yes gene_type:complete
MINKKLKQLSLIISLVFIQSCSLNLNLNNYNFETDSLGSFNLADYNEFSLNMNQSDLSAEVNPIKFEKLKNSLTEALEDRGLTLNPDANINIELILEPKEKLKLSKYPRRSPYYYGYEWNMDQLETTQQFILRVNIKDISADKVVWTGLTKWRKSSSKDPLTEEYLQFIVDSILQSN